MSDKNKSEKPEVHDDISGFDIKINEFGELVTNMKIDEINTFLKEQVSDKKLQGHSEEE